MSHFARSAQLSTTGFFLPHQLIRVCLPQWPGSDQPKTEWACLVRNTWWHQRLELAHSPFARVRQAFGTSLSVVCSFTLSIRSFATFSIGNPWGFTRLPRTHTPNSYYYRHIYTSNMSSGQLCSPRSYWLVLPSTIIIIIQQSSPLSRSLS